MEKFSQFRDKGMSTIHPCALLKPYGSHLRHYMRKANLLILTPNTFRLRGVSLYSDQDTIDDAVYNSSSLFVSPPPCPVRYIRSSLFPPPSIFTFAGSGTEASTMGHDGDSGHLVGGPPD